MREEGFFFFFSHSALNEQAEIDRLCFTDNEEAGFWKTFWQEPI